MYVDLIPTIKLKYATTAFPLKHLPRLEIARQTIIFKKQASSKSKKLRTLILFEKPNGDSSYSTGTSVRLFNTIIIRNFVDN